MARYKIHYEDAAGQAACRANHRRLLPLKTSRAWPPVTCRRCLAYRPKRSLWQRIMDGLGLLGEGGLK